MLGFRPLASRPLASGIIPAVADVEQPVYGGWLPVKYLDRDGNETSLQDAPKQIALDIAAEDDTAAQDAIKESVKSLLAQIDMQRTMQDNQRAIDYLESMAMEVEAAQREAERLRWISDPRVIAEENDNALAALMLSGLI